MHIFSKLLVFSFLSLLVSNAHSGGEAKPDCQIYGSTVKDQIMGYIDSRQSIVSAKATSASVTSDDRSITNFSIEKVWRDQIGLPEKNIEVHTYYSKSIDYSVGEEYLLYLGYEDASGNFMTNVCLGTKSIKDVSKLEFDLLEELTEKQSADALNVTGNNLTN